MNYVVSDEGMEYDEYLDASGLVCPLPVLKAKAALAKMSVGEVLKVQVTHADSTREFPMLGKLPEFELLHHEETGFDYRFWIKRIAESEV